MQKKSYGIQLAILDGILWFVDLLNSTILHVASPEIASYFRVPLLHMEWMHVSFLMALVIGLILSIAIARKIQIKRGYLLGQILYLVAILGCATTTSIGALILFRIMQGLAMGIVLPIAFSLVVIHLPKIQWAKVTSLITLFSLTAPAVGTIGASYILTFFHWRWLFFAKVPIALILFCLTCYWVKEEKKEKEDSFDWLGTLLFSILTLSALYTFTLVGKSSSHTRSLILLVCTSTLSGYLFFLHLKKSKKPLIPPALFSYPQFNWGLLIQSVSNLLFLGSTFILALYLERGLHLSVIATGWLLAAITPGLATALPFVGKYYNRLGPLPFMIPGLLILSASMAGMLFLTCDSSYGWIATLIFLQGVGTSFVQQANMLSIFSTIPAKLQPYASTIYPLCKYLSAAFGIAISVMLVSLTATITKIQIGHISDFRAAFCFFALLPLGALYCCRYLKPRPLIV